MKILMGRVCRNVSGTPLAIFIPDVGLFETSLEDFPPYECITLNLKQMKKLRNKLDKEIAKEILEDFIECQRNTKVNL